MPTGFLPSTRASSANLFSEEDLQTQRAFFAKRPMLAPTPLHRCSALARHLGIGELWVKDETSRFGLNAFKSTGALFAISTLVDRGDIRAGDTLACASEGNHGRAVARAAREVQCRARVYMSRTVAPARVQAIQSEGAEVVLVDGNYDEAVRAMARDATVHRWTIISDTSWPGYHEIPRLIMLGYTRLMDEVHDALAAQHQSPAFDAVFAPAGVGGLLAAVACWADLRYGSGRPRVVAVEPRSAACVQASVRAGMPTAVPGPFTTTMGGLRCGEMSPDVYPAVAALVDAFVGIEDEFAFEAIRLLARPAPPDPKVECAPSGAAATGGLLAVVSHNSLDDVRNRLAIGAESRVLVLVTEGVTDPAVVQEALSK
jgi:diaminopropionate ammonia-lyase